MAEKTNLQFNIDGVTLKITIWEPLIIEFKIKPWKILQIYLFFAAKSFEILNKIKYFLWRKEGWVYKYVISQKVVFLSLWNLLLKVTFVNDGTIQVGDTVLTILNI